RSSDVPAGRCWYPVWGDFAESPRLRARFNGLADLGLGGPGRGRSRHGGRTMKVLDSRLLRRAAAGRRYLVISSLVAVTSGLLIIVGAFAISKLVVLAFQDRAGLADMRGPLTVLGFVVLGRALLAWVGQVAAHRAAADVKSQLRRELLTHTIRL